ncbi:MAG: N-acetylmannosamine-6-phosphate 2-epimerase [Bacillota bacterium]
MKSIEGGLIVSCQALEHEPLHSSFIMGKMALAAKQSGAVGIRCNTVSDIREIKNSVDLPLIGIIKQNYGECNVYITPTMKEVDALVAEGVDIIAIDATDRLRPDGKTTEQFVKEIKNKYPGQLLMADIATLSEAKNASIWGCDYVGTTLHGYTESTVGCNVAENDFQFLREVVATSTVPVIAEGKVDTPEKARRVLDLGAYCVVVGGAITRPQEITQRFVAAINH